ncbi:MAG: glycosyltransferase [Deltaproteobacteria bacterium]|nr:glycosyltransferase [Deltaproteobacteria bacterium]
MSLSISIVIATKGRLEGLQRLFSSLKKIPDWREIRPEVIVGNNADDPSLARAVQALVEAFGGEVGNVRHLREENPSQPRAKCRTQNLAIAQARGEIIAFIDDDVEVTPQWLSAIYDFFRHNRIDAMQGPILIPPEMQNNQEFLRIYHRYRTIPFVQYQPEVMEIRTLTGGNMAMRAELFSRTGLFDERLGPGRSGISEDVEFAQRIFRSGGRIGYEPKAAVYHEVDWSRLTEEFFRLRHEQQGRSRLLYKKSSIFTIVPNLMRSVWTLGWYALVGNERRKYRAKGRYYHYRAMLLEKSKTFKPFNAF